MEVHEMAMREEFYDYFNGFLRNPITSDEEWLHNEGLTSHVWLGELMNGKRES